MSQTASKSFTFNVAAVPVLSIATASLPDAVEFSVYSQQLQATGGTPPYFWSLTAGALPAGLSLSQNGVINGIPTASGPFTITVQVQDSGA